jgi:hypothetical protein
MSLKEELARIIAKKRVYASSDEGGPDVTDAQVELGIVEDLLESIECSGEAIYVDPVSGANPPDCIARGIGGERVAIEVTEFVCRTAVEINQKADRAAIARFEPDVMVARVWQRSDFLQHLERLLKTKDGKTYVGGPFARVVLLVHTDEPMLIRSQWENWLLGHRRDVRSYRDACLCHPPSPCKPGGVHIYACCPFNADTRDKSRHRIPA